MSLGGGSSRRIGPPSLWERIADPLRFAGVVAALFAAGSVFVTWVQNWGHRLSIEGWIQSSCIVFALQLAVVGISALIGPRKDRGVALILVGGLLVVAVWFWGLSMLEAFGLVEVLPITPVQS